MRYATAAAFRQALEPRLKTAAATFLDPILAGRSSGEWDPQDATWA